MLTRADRTVEDCLEILDTLTPLGLGHIGFKDIGVDRSTMRTLARGIRERGARSYLEVVSTDPGAEIASAECAVEIEVDCLLGGTTIAPILERLEGSPIDYFPFVGEPVGHPTQLNGDADLIAQHCEMSLESGCAGVDLLAYRATEAPPLDLVAAARRHLAPEAKLIVAGSIDRPQQIEALAAAGCDAFTVGSAIFSGAFAPHHGGLRAQLEAVERLCRHTIRT